MTASMRDFSIIDTHVHFWDPRRISYPWLGGKALLDRPYLIEDYLRASAGIPLDSIVFLECDASAEQGLDEVAFVEEQAAAEPRIRACVPRAPLERGTAVEPLLESMVARFPRIKGIRRIIENEPRELVLSDEFIAGVKLLSKFGLHFEITANFRQMDAVLEFVKHTPHVSMVLDHCGKPGIRGGHLDLFRRHMSELALYPNVFCKLSGLVTEADWERWSGETLRPFIDVVLGAFGVDRVMYGSDWPVCLQATSLRRWLQAIDDAVAGCSESDRRKIYRDNAMSFYRLTSPS